MSGWIPSSRPTQDQIGHNEKFVFTGAEDFAASVAPSGVHRVIAGAAKDLVRLGAKLLVYQRQAALVAQETGLVPMAILVRQILEKSKTPF